MTARTWTVPAVVAEDNYGYQAHGLAAKAGVDSGRNDTSPGSLWLVSVFEAYVRERDEIAEAGYPRDAISELVQRVCDPGTQETWAIVTDLKLYTHNFDEGLYAEHLDYQNPRTYRTEHVWAIRTEKLADALGWWLYEVASWLVYALAREDEIDL